MWQRKTRKLARHDQIRAVNKKSLKNSRVLYSIGKVNVQNIESFSSSFTLIFL